MYDKSTIGCLFFVMSFTFFVAISVAIGIIFGIWWGVVAFAALVAIFTLFLLVVAMSKNKKE